MKKILTAIVFFAIVVLGGSFAQAKDKNNLDQYDRQLVADMLQVIDNFNYPLAKEGWWGWKKIDQYGQPITSDQRVVSLYHMLSFLYQQYEIKFAGLVNDSSCGDESVVSLYAWQTRMFGGLPGYGYLKGTKLKVERVSLQADGTGWIKNITCARNVTGLDGVSLGQEEYVKSILTATFPGFVWGNVVWTPDDGVSFGVEVLSIPTEYLPSALEEPRH